MYANGNITAFTSAAGAKKKIKKINEKVRNCSTAEDCSALFVTEKIFERINELTSLYAAQLKNFRRRKNK